MNPAVYAFDLGDTLVEYEGLPLSWVDYYPEALGRLAASLGLAPSVEQVEAACEVLRRHNTRLHPRLVEIPFTAILGEICRSFAAPAAADPDSAAQAFFSVFRQRLRVFPDTVSSLETLRQRGAKIAVLTDVPYGMPRALVLEDIRETGLEHLLDLIVTSNEVGYRKPAPETLAYVARAFGKNPLEIVYVGNEPKDVEVARAIGCEAILVVRSGIPPAWGQDRTILSLKELREGA
jgi:putative hydrolase of the HAD superfamily